MATKKLIETNSALYAKRIVREINQIRGAGKIGLCQR